MARKVKCCITGEQGTSDTFIKIGSKYYKSQEVYEEAEEKKRLHKKIVDTIVYDLLKYSPGQPYPTVVNKKLKELDYYSDKVIYETLKDCYDSLKYFMDTKDFKNDYGRVSYIFGALSNHINDVNKKFKQNRIDENNEEVVADQLFDIAESNFESKNKKHTKNISRFIDE